MLKNSLSLPGLLFSLILLIALYSCGSEVRNAEPVNTNFIDENPAIANTNRVVYILPLENRADPDAYRNTSFMKGILFNSFYSFIPYLPGINVPEKPVLMTLKPGDAAMVSSVYKPDYIVYGSYIFKGNKSNPRALITIRIMSGTSEKSFSNTYSAPTDIDLFDSVDRIIEDIGGFLLKEKTRVAHINFGDFNTGPYDYDLRINSRLVSRVTNNDFKLSLNVLAGVKYHIELVRLSDSTNMIDDDLILAPGGSTNYSYYEWTLFDAAKKGNAAFIRGFKGDVNITDYIGSTALIYAAANGRTEAVRALIDKGANVNAVDTTANSALMQASINGHADTVQALIKAGADLDEKDSTGSTALICAVIKNRIDPIKSLIKAGAYIDNKDCIGRTALIYAAIFENAEAVELLLKAGADARILDMNGLKAIQYVVDPDVIKMLKGADGK
jgi:hypothetical protein